MTDYTDLDMATVRRDHHRIIADNGYVTRGNGSYISPIKDVLVIAELIHAGVPGRAVLTYANGHIAARNARSGEQDVDSNLENWAQTICEDMAREASNG